MPKPTLDQTAAAPRYAKEAKDKVKRRGSMTDAERKHGTALRSAAKPRSKRIVLDDSLMAKHGVEDTSKEKAVEAPKGGGDKK